MSKKAKELHERSCEVFNKKCLAVSESKLIAGSCLKIISNKLDSIHPQTDGDLWETNLKAYSYLLNEIVTIPV